MLIPLGLMIASSVSSYRSYTDARLSIADELNEAVTALANANSGLWTRQDTIAALRYMHEAIHKPLIYQASDVNFRNKSLRTDAYFAISLVEKDSVAPKIQGHLIASDSIMLVPEKSVDNVAIRVQGFADCSMASVFAASDQTVPGQLFSLSILIMATIMMWRRKHHFSPMAECTPHTPIAACIDRIKLTPMQRQLTRMLIEAPGMKVDKATLCASLWGGKYNADESLYTLVRRTKVALADADIEIICNRGESYQLRINA